MGSKGDREGSIVGLSQDHARSPRMTLLCVLSPQPAPANDTSLFQLAASTSDLASVGGAVGVGLAVLALSLDLYLVLVPLPYSLEPEYPGVLQCVQGIFLCNI